MKLVNESLLDQYRGPGVCELCLRNVPDRRPHHLLSRGAGRVDIPANLAALCFYCHRAVHDNVEQKERIFAVVALREGLRVEDIEAQVWLVRRSEK